MFYTPFFDLTWSFFEVRCIIYDIPMVIFLVLTHTFLNTINQISFFHFFISSFQRSAFHSLILSFFHFSAAQFLTQKIRKFTERTPCAA